MNGSPALFQKCLAASALLHGAFFFFGRGLPPRAPADSPVEIDLTRNPFLGTGPAKLGAPKKLVPNAPPGPSLPAEANQPPQAVTPSAPKPWVLPGPETKKIEKPEPPPPTPGGAPNGTGTSPLTGGHGAGADYGTPNGTGNGGAALLRLPVLLNRDEVLANLRRFYPESERRAGHEGTVLVNLHIGADGRVADVDVVRSAGPAFDGAATKVGQLMRFAPALAISGPVPVKIAQPMVFQLRD